MSEPLYCVNHPKVETYLRCNKCGQPICPKCAVQTPVGYRCRDCVNAQQRVYYADFRPVHYLVAGVVALPLALVAAWLVPSLGWFAIFLGPAAGTGIAEAARWAIQRRRGQYVWLVVCGSIAAGTLIRLLISFVPILLLSAAAEAPLGYYAAGWTMSMLWNIVYLVTAVGAAYARLRPGRRI
jgi:hypothetical protein